MRSTSQSCIVRISVSSDGRLAGSTSPDEGSIILWDITAGIPLLKIDREGLECVRSISIAHTASIAITFSSDDNVTHTFAFRMRWLFDPALLPSKDLLHSESSARLCV